MPNEMDPTFAMKYSYYELYLQQEQQEQEQSLARNLGTASASTDDSSRVVLGDKQQEQQDDNDNPVQEQQQQQDQDQKDALWIQDTWTTADQEAAQAQIQAMADKCRVSDALRRKLPTHAAAWNGFYQQHQTNFFKDRHYLATAFPEEFGNASDNDGRPRKKILVEIGCGVGNTMLPLLEPKHSIEWTVYGVDLSAVAIDLLRQDARFVQHAPLNRAWAAQADLTSDAGLPRPCRGVADVATLLFCLSAIAPEHHAKAAANAVQALQPGGVLLLRDYGRYDQAELQLATQRAKRLTDHFYVKHDQTCCYYFTTQDLHSLFVKQNGLIELENGYILRQYQNRGEKTTRRRVWVQARFRRQAEDHLVPEQTT